VGSSDRSIGGIGSQLRTLVTGTVTNAFLTAIALSHAVTVNIDVMEIQRIKTLVRAVSGFTERGYRWPFTAMSEPRNFLLSKATGCWNNLNIAKFNHRRPENMVKTKDTASKSIRIIISSETLFPIPDRRGNVHRKLVGGGKPVQTDDLIELAQ
jgi:hypothetical protein